MTSQKTAAKETTLVGDKRSHRYIIIASKHFLLNYCYLSYAILVFFTSAVKICDQPNICPRYSTCKNTSDSYVCNCNEGYYNTTDGCRDINECKTGAHKCNTTTSKCVNLIGSHSCECLKGLTGTEGKCVGKCVKFANFTQIVHYCQ